MANPRSFAGKFSHGSFVAVAENLFFIVQKIVSYALDSDLSGLKKDFLLVFVYRPKSLFIYVSRLLRNSFLKVFKTMENVMQNINLSINYIELSDEEVQFDWLDIKINERLKELINDFKKCTDSGDKITLYDEVS